MHKFPDDRTIYDLAVVGGGVVGCATARRFALEGARVILLERANDLLAGASKGNSAILHTGFDAPAGSVELACIRDGYAQYLAIREALNLPLLRTGAVLVAWTDDEVARLDGIVRHAHANGIDDVRHIGRDELFRREPHLSRTALAAVSIPGESVIDPWSAPLAYARQAVAHGAEVHVGCDVTGASRERYLWTLHTSRGDVRARCVANCAGLHGDTLERRLLGTAAFEIRPRNGQFVVFDKAAAALVGGIVLPVPSAHTKGLVLTRTAFGNVLAGPTADAQHDRDHARVDEETLRGLIAFAVVRVPGLAGMPVTATYAGLRPASDAPDYRLVVDVDAGYLCAGGIRSTGLSSALGIASHLYARYAQRQRHEPPARVIATPVPNLAENAPRDWQRPGYGAIVCHCESVTEREILAALADPLPAGDLGGLKRRTRAGMGRCQGFYCGARVAALARGVCADAPAERAS